MIFSIFILSFLFNNLQKIVGTTVSSNTAISSSSSSSLNEKEGKIILTQQQQDQCIEIIENLLKTPEQLKEIISKEKKKKETFLSGSKSQVFLDQCFNCKDPKENLVNQLTALQDKINKGASERSEIIKSFAFQINSQLGIKEQVFSFFRVPLSKEKEKELKDRFHVNCRNGFSLWSKVFEKERERDISKEISREFFDAVIKPSMKSDKVQSCVNQSLQIEKGGPLLKAIPSKASIDTPSDYILLKDYFTNKK